MSDTGEARRDPTTFLDSIGSRGRRRAEPRPSIALAGAGCALAVLGVLLVSGDSGSSDDSFNQVPGIILTGLVLVGGFVVLQRMRQGPIATAGTVAAVLAVPPFMLFLTFDEGGFPPWSTEGILLVSTIVWTGAFLVGAGRGRPLFLGAALFGAWASLLQMTEKVFDLPFTFFDAFFYAFDSTFEQDPFAAGGFGGPSFPDPTSVGMLSLGVGLIYIGSSRWMDKRGYAGAATPFLVAALPALAVGVLFLGDDLEAAGAGLLLTAVGAGLTLHGSSVGRRATTWIGAAATAAGLAVFMSDLTDDATVGGMLYVAAGIGLVALAYVLAMRTDEADEMALTEPAEPVARRVIRPPSAEPPAPDAR